MKMKMKTKIQINVLSIDARDDTIHFQSYFSNGHCSTTLETYGYANEFQDFAKKLTEFPKSIDDVAIYKLGERGIKWAYYLLIKVYCSQPNGRASIRIEATNNSISPYYHESIFEIESQAASLNRLGKSLLHWNPRESKKFEWTPNQQ